MNPRGLHQPSGLAGHPPTGLGHRRIKRIFFKGLNKDSSDDFHTGHIREIAKILFATNRGIGRCKWSW